MIIRQANPNDYDAVWDIFRAVIQSGDTYVFAPHTPKSDLQQHWFAPTMHTYVAEVDGEILGTYILKPNQIDLGNHVANGSYMVHPKGQGKGVGRAMGAHSIGETKRLGFMALQFNLVVATNQPAIYLWKSLGFQIVGTVPKVFRHKSDGFVDAHVMYQWFGEE